MSDLSQFRKPYKTEKRLEAYLASGKCPVCTMLLSSKFHTDCPYLNRRQDEKS